MDRKSIRAWFQESPGPEWQCPTCEKSILKIVPGSFHKEELRLSREAHGHDAWDPDWIEYTYSCLLKCSNNKCEEVVANSGKGRVDYDVIVDPTGNYEHTYADFFQPLYFNPQLKIFKIPNSCPDSVSEPLNVSFRLFFACPEAACNSVRIAVESLLTELGVKRYQTSKGKRYPISLHSRIGLLSSAHEEIKDLLMAIKWIGNAGSHPGDPLTIDDAMDSYELIEHVLHELYEPKSKRLKKLAKSVNKRKGVKK